MPPVSPRPAPDKGPVRTREELRDLIRERVDGRLFVSVSNREPFVHSHGVDGSIEVRAAVGGLTLALNSAMQAVGGVWVAHGSGDADRETADERGRLWVPPGNPAYELQRVWLGRVENDGYYNGFANQALWPLCHTAYTKPVFRTAHWDAYRSVNAKFADAVSKVVGDREAIVFIQDYHFGLLPALIRTRCPRAVCLHFWHIPWPLADVFAICPWAGELLDGLLGNDVVGVHTPKYARRFLEAARTRPGWRLADERTLENGERRTRVQEFPISVDFDAISASASSAACDAAVERLRERYGLSGKFVVLGLDRIDYTKGLLERIEAIECLLERYPAMRGRVAYLHAGAPSRTEIPAYRALQDAMDRSEARINGKYASAGAKPVVAIKRHLHVSEVMALYRLADVCVVSSLEDGMNLVAKEFLAARNDEGGRLLLSEFTGAAWELPGAETFNPFATDEFAHRLFAMSGASTALDRERMRRLRTHVQTNNIYGWIGKILETVPPRRDGN